MRKLLSLIALLILPALTFAQAGGYASPTGAGGVSPISSLPAICSPGVTASVQLTVAPYTINYCSALNTWSEVGSIPSFALITIPGSANNSVSIGSSGVGGLSTNISTNTSIGGNAGAALTPSASVSCTGTFKQGTDNTLLGRNGVSLTTGCLNTAVGVDAAVQLISGFSNTLIGVDAGQLGTAYNYVTAIGMLAAGNNTANETTALGYNAMYQGTSGTFNTALGTYARQNITTGNDDTAVGYQALLGGIGGGSPGGGDNTAMGYVTAHDITSGAKNTVIGSTAGRHLTSSSSNTALGFAALLTDLTGDNNTAVGQQALTSTTVANNTAVGALALYGDSSGTDNTAVGQGAGYNTFANKNTTGSQNTWVGSNAGPNTASQLTNAISIGYNAFNTASNEAVIGNSSVTDVYEGSETAAANEHAASYRTATNCSSSASPAVCASASAGSIAVPTGTNPTLVVNTTAVTANSQIFLNADESLGTKLGITCNSTLTSLAVEPVVTARTAATSFTVQISGVISTNAVCLSYFIVN